jgi:N-formylmaleamate deformylase
VAELGLDRPVLVGHSLGARVAAAASLRDPGLARALVLVDPPLSGPGSGLYPLSLESFLDGDFGRRYPRWLPEDAELWERWLPTCATAAVVATHRGFDEDGFLPLWHRLRGPLALIHGADSQMITAAAAEELAEANDAAAVISVPDSGHMAPWDNPEGFVAVLRRVVQMLTAPVERKP